MEAADHSSRSKRSTNASVMELKLQVSIKSLYNLKKLLQNEVIRHLNQIFFILFSVIKVLLPH